MSSCCGGRHSRARTRRWKEPTRPSPKWPSCGRSRKVTMSRNAHKPTAETRNMVQLLTGMGSGADDVARVLGVTARTIFRHYRTELDRGVAVANMNVAQSLYRKAMGNGPQSVAACI